jgi:hypothetical protein
MMLSLNSGVILKSSRICLLIVLTANISLNQSIHVLFFVFSSSLIKKIISECGYSSSVSISRINHQLNSSHSFNARQR